MNEQEPKPENKKSELQEVYEKYNLTTEEKWILFISLAPFYFGSPNAFREHRGQQVDIDRYAREVVAKRKSASE